MQSYVHTDEEGTTHTSPFRVHVLSADKEEILGFGTVIGEVLIEDLDWGSPAIQLDSGELIYGYECWWVPARLIADKLPDPQPLEE